MAQQEEIITTDEEHIICLSKEEDKRTIVQFCNTIQAPKWAKWAYRIVTRKTQEEWTQKHEANRVSNSLFVIPVKETA
jgi:hypothetical protein